MKKHYGAIVIRRNFRLAFYSQEDRRRRRMNLLLPIALLAISLASAEATSEETSPAAQPLDLLKEQTVEGETSILTGEPDDPPEKPIYPAEEKGRADELSTLVTEKIPVAIFTIPRVEEKMSTAELTTTAAETANLAQNPMMPVTQPTSLAVGTTELTVETTASAAEKTTAIADTEKPVVEPLTPAVQTIAAAAETTIPDAGTITPIETMGVVTETIVPVSKTTLHAEVMTNSAAKLVTLTTERIPAVETSMVELTNPVTPGTQAAEPTAFVAEPTNLPAEAKTEDAQIIMASIETTTRAPEIIPAVETVMVAAEWSTSVHPAAKPMILGAGSANPSMELELVTRPTQPALGTGWTNSIVASAIFSTERSVPATEKTNVASETIDPTMEVTQSATHNLAITPTVPNTIIFLTEKIIPTMETTSSLAVVTNQATEKTSLTVEKIPVGETTVAATQQTVSAILEVELTRPSERPVTPTAEQAVPSVEPATSTTEAVTVITEQAITTMKPTHLFSHPSTLIADPASSTGDLTALTVSPTILAAEPATLSEKPATAFAEPVPPPSESANPAALSIIPTAGPAIPAEPATSTAEPATSTTSSTILATETATGSTAGSSIPTAESTTPIAESRTSVGPHSLAVETAIPDLESISTAVKLITHLTVEPTILGLDRIPEMTATIPATEPPIPVEETRTTSTHNVVLSSDSLPVSDIIIPHLELTHSATEGVPSSTQPITIVTGTIPSTESTASAKMTDPTTHMVLLVTEPTTVAKKMSPSGESTAAAETKTIPVAETTIPVGNPTTSTVEQTVFATGSITTGFRTPPAISSTVSGVKRRRPTRKMTNKVQKVTTLARPTAGPKPGLETAKVFDAAFGKITNLNNNIRFATDSQVTKLTEIWLAFKLYVDALQNKTIDTSRLNPTFSLSTTEEVKTWKNLFETFMDKMRNRPKSQVKKVVAAWTALYKFLLSYKVPTTTKQAMTKLTTSSLNRKSTTQTPVNGPIVQASTSGLHEGFESYVITSENKMVANANARRILMLENQMENLKNELKHSTKKQLEKYRESWAVFKFYLDSFLPGSKPNEVPAAQVSFTLSSPAEASRNRAKFMDFIKGLHPTSGFRPDAILKYWEELNNLLDSYQGIDTETTEKPKSEINSRPFEALPRGNLSSSSTILAEQKTQISNAQLHDSVSNKAVDTKFARIAYDYELQRSTSSKLRQFKENWIVFKLYLDSLKSNSTNNTINYHFLFSDEREQKYIHEIFSNFVQDLRRSPGFLLEELMQSWHILNEYLNSYKGADTKNIFASADPGGDHKSVPRNSEDAISSTEDLRFKSP